MSIIIMLTLRSFLNLIKSITLISNLYMQYIYEDVGWNLSIPKTKIFSGSRLSNVCNVLDRQIFTRVIILDLILLQISSQGFSTLHAQCLAYIEVYVQKLILCALLSEYDYYYIKWILVVSLCLLKRIHVVQYLFITLLYF